MSAWRVGVLCLGLPLVVMAVLAAWWMCSPATLVQTRIVTDLGGPAGRAALAEAAVRMDAGVNHAPSRSAVLGEHGQALLIAVADEDAATALRLARSAADTVLDLPLAATRRPSEPPVSRGVPPTDTRGRLLAERNRLQATADALDSRLAAVSAALSGITRDVAAGLRVAADRKPGRETLEKGAAALAELQLQRIQLQSRYQDDFPAVLALDGQIRSLRSFLAEEGRRIDTPARSQPDPADPILAAERDRLRAELAQLNDRRAGLGVELAAAGRALAVAKPGELAPRPEPLFSTPPVPVLVEAATTVASGPDNRWIAAPAAAGAGLLLVLLGWYGPPRPQRAAQAQLAAGRTTRLPRGAVAMLPSRDSAVLGLADPPRLLRLLREKQGSPLHEEGDGRPLHS